MTNKTFNCIENEVKSKFEKSVANNILSSIQILQNGELRWCNNFPVIEKSFDGIMSFEVKNILWPGPRKIITGGKSHFTNRKLVHELYASIFDNFKADEEVVEF